ncbi:MAG TPA: GTPase HflX, partial [Oligoflexia bacterium]|nr:GTPase HflX [Oligoflexia bacterium]
KTYLGSGKLEELRKQMDELELDLLLVDFDLSPSQLKNVEKITQKLVLDRSGIILEIFNRHARSKEAKLQVETARLQYLMPRLTNLWSHFERQRGSGGGALKGKGMGEKQIEVDRRLVKDRLTHLRRKLVEVEASRDLHRRQRESILKVALVGYTNAGKSTLLNALTKSEVLVEDALFATLDASVRLLTPKARPAVLAIDTVGFIDRLPHGLVASFRSTLGEVLEADLLVHVLDGSSEEVQRHCEVTMKVLAELGAHQIPMLLVFNKMDQCKKTQMLKIWANGLYRETLDANEIAMQNLNGAEPPRFHIPKEGAALFKPVFLSALDLSQVSQLRERILSIFDSQLEIYELVVPFEDGKTVSQIFDLSRVEVRRPLETGTFFRIRTLPEFAARINVKRYQA